MNIEIVTQPLQLDIYGFGGIAANKDYTGTLFQLSGKMWQIVKAANIKNKGKNIWVNNTNHYVFAGVELENPINENNNHGLEKITLNIGKYAYFKHIGAYSLIKHSGQQMTSELEKKGFETTLPYIEIYGHWTNDETKLETALIMSLK